MGLPAKERACVKSLGSSKAWGSWYRGTGGGKGDGRPGGTRLCRGLQAGELGQGLIGTVFNDGGGCCVEAGL